MLDGNLLLYCVLALILVAEFVNGWTDSPNAIATVVSTRVLSPYQALIMATILNAVGAMSGTAVAATIGKDIVSADVINLTTVGARHGRYNILEQFSVVLRPADERK